MEDKFNNIKMEDDVRSKIIVPERHHTLLTYLKPALGLICSFGLIYGVAYGVLSMTGSLSDETPESIEIIENGYLSSSFIDHFNEDMEMSRMEGFNHDTDSIAEEDIVSFLTSELTPAELSLIYADVLK